MMCIDFIGLCGMSINCEILMFKRKENLKENNSMKESMIIIMCHNCINTFSGVE